MRILLVTLLALAATPALAETAHCESPDTSVVIDVDFSVDAEAGTGTIAGVRAKTEHLTVSTYPGENGTAGAETLAIGELAYDRMQVGLESANAGPMTLTLDIVRTANYEPGDAAETGIVVAGVASVASVGTTTVTCSGW